ncbi:uncharacterized protein LOC115665121 isoform X2 [Syzygium oleosum]|uniref:uncharacterized protein LOC115665121 isoform X2 n=1 Tax=Syzygium oleosum TaxID=219896 RepID=UPI0024BAFFB1|nr:uncharacterized protein LOC115665121 isoform X2 [Syzygium oleosum]
MSVKRSRTARSSSSGDTGSVAAGVGQLSSPAAPPPAPADADADPDDQRRRAAPRPGILTLSSPAAAEDWSQERIGNFLEMCSYCEKRIGESDEVFMYGTCISRSIGCSIEMY